MDANVESGKMIQKLFIMFCVFASVGSESCKAFQIKKEYLNKRLIGHEIAELPVKGHHECVRECFYLSSCKSTDYYKVNSTCTLNDAGSESVETTEFEDTPGAVFSDITDWPSGMAGVCGQRPCSEKQKCFPDKNGYLCREACGRVPTIENGIVALDKPGKMLYMDTATVTCNEGYWVDKSSIQCQASGTWESVSCEMTCGNVASIGNGIVALDTSGKTFHMDTATVTCNEGYGTDKPSIQCQDFGTWEPVSCEMITDCKDMLRYFPSLSSGVYEIQPWQSLYRLSVYCDMDTEDGGWTVFQSRFNGSVDFYRNSTEYENGFGNLITEFWLGLKHVHVMASQGPTELRLDISAANGSTAYETFQNFYLDVGPEYTLHIDRGTGTAGDDPLLYGLSYHNGQPFTTYDVDRDPHLTGNCAVDQHGGWWYNQCGGANLNGEYATPGFDHPNGYWFGMFYQQYIGTQSLKTSRLMFRRV